MFFVTYLRRELRRRMRQAIVIALGLALGIGIVITVAAVSAGVEKAQSGVLSSLYGVGTDVTVTGPAQPPPAPGAQPQNGQTLQLGPGGSQICADGHCVNAAGHTVDQLYPPLTRPISASMVTAVARLHDVSAAAGVLALTDTSTTFPANFGGKGTGSVPQGNSFTVDGVETGHAQAGPLRSATITSGRSFTATDADTDVAVVDSGYATSNSLKAGSVIILRQVSFTVIGIVSQPQGSSPPDVYLPLARAQALASASKLGGSLGNVVNLIYVTAASAADVGAVQHQISRLLPGDTVTTSSSLAGQVTGSLSTAAKLASDLGRWLSAVVLIAAFAVASLLTTAAVARRACEFGTLKAIGWRTRRIVAQVLGESVIMGIAGAAAGTGIGYAGAAIIATVAPELSAASPPAVAAPQFSTAGPGSPVPVPSHPVLVPLSPSVTTGVIVLAVALALLGGLLAGALASWRIARLRPADALARVA
jgi:putative ABC transport system permease protein